MKDSRAFALGLGGNQGDVLVTLRECLRSIEADSRVTGVSSAGVYETEPWGDVRGGNFLNTAMSGYWSGTDRELLSFCRSLEKAAGSPVRKEGGARNLDVDVLFIQNGESTAEMTIPHRRMAERRFVLLPLSEVWADVVPGLPGTPRDLLRLLNDDSPIIFRCRLKED